MLENYKCLPQGSIVIYKGTRALLLDCVIIGPRALVRLCSKINRTVRLTVNSLIQKDISNPQREGMFRALLTNRSYPQR